MAEEAEDTAGALAALAESTDTLLESAGALAAEIEAAQAEEAAQGEALDARLFESVAPYRLLAKDDRDGDLRREWALRRRWQRLVREGEALRERMQQLREVVRALGAEQQRLSSRSQQLRLDQASALERSEQLCALSADLRAQLGLVCEWSADVASYQRQRRARLAGRRGSE
jgi:hypothetical protein